MSEELYVNLEFYVAGVKFHQYKEIQDELEEGMTVNLVPEPDNEYDVNAIKVMWYDWMLGYAPAKTGQAAHIAKALKAGVKLWAVITKSNPDADVDYRKLKIWVREEETLPPATSDEEEL